MDEESAPVLIVGGSLVGLSTAMLLGLLGVPTLVVERHGGTAIHPRAAHFHLRTLEILRAAGIEDEVRRASEEQYDSDGGISAVESLAGREIAQYIPSLNAGVELVSPSRRLFLTQDALEPILRARALELGAQLRYQTELAGFEDTGDGVRATIRDLDHGGAERVVEARYMVGADGWRSPVRERLGIAMVGHGLISNSVTIYFRADCSEYRRGRTDGVLYVFNDVLSGFFRLDRDWRSGFLVVNTAGDTSLPAATNVSEGIDDERAATLLRGAIGAPIDVEIVDIAPWQAIADVATSFQRGRVLIAGDAAHTVPPNGGFGGNTGVQDAFNLAWKLAAVLDGSGGSGLPATYDAERQPIGRLTIEQAYSRYVVRTAPYLGTDQIQPLVDDLSLEIGHRYRSAAVIEEAREDDGLPYVDPRSSRALPGTRAPHVWLERASTRLSTLDLFGRRFVALAGPDGSAWCEAVAAAAARARLGVDVHRIGERGLGDHDAGFVDAYGLSPAGCLLVRPDGYVGWRAGAGEEPSGATAARVLGALLCRAR